MERPSDFDRLGDLLKEACRPLGTARGVETHARGAGMHAVSEAGAAEGLGAEDGQSFARFLASVWSATVGEEVAANARPVHLRDGRLTVSTSSSAWAQTLQLMAETVRQRLNERLGAEVVSAVFFRHAGWEESAYRGRMGAGEGGSGPPLGTGGTRVAGGSLAPTPEESAAIAEVKELGLEPDLEESILRAMRASFGRPRRAEDVRGEKDSVR